MVGGRETGNETYVLGLIGGLASIGSSGSLSIYHAAGMDGRFPSAAELKPVTASAWGRLILELPWRSWRDHLDVLHTTYTAPIASACPVVLTVHDISYAEHPEWFSVRDLRVLSNAVPWSIRMAARVITVSDLCRAQIIERYRVPAQKVVTVHNAAGPAGDPIDLAEARAALLRLGIDPAKKLVLAVGNLQPRKNLVRLVEAFAQVASSGVDADLVLVGPEHFRADLVHAAASSVAGRVHFTGYLSDRDLAACYACATLFAYPSLFEGFGIPPLEAMSHGTPVACSRAGALPEVCGDAVEYFDPLDVASMTAALELLLKDDSKRAELSRAGRARAQQFSWRRAAEQTLAVYQDVRGVRALSHTGG